MFVVHLVRDGLSVLESVMLKGKNSEIEGCYPFQKRGPTRITLSWMIANVSAFIFGRVVGPRRYLLVRYEDFIADPVAEMKRLGKFAGFEAGEVVEALAAGRKFQVGHHVSGSRIRYQGEIQLFSETRLTGNVCLKLRDKLVFTIIAGWLKYLLGYRVLSRDKDSRVKNGN